MVKISDKQLFEYMQCPAMFEMKYIKKIPEDKKELALSEILDKAAKYFLINLLNKRIVSNIEIKKKWDSLCQEYNLDAKKTMQGLDMLFKLLNFAQRHKLVVLDMETEYQLNFNHIELRGNLGTIIAAPKDKFELLITSFSSKNLDKDLIDMKLKYTLDILAFKTIHGRTLQGVKIHHIKTDKDIFTCRNEGDIKRLQTTINNVGLAIKNKIYYPRESFMCSSCNYKNYCRYWFC